MLRRCFSMAFFEITRAPTKVGIKKRKKDTMKITLEVTVIQFGNFMVFLRGNN